MAVQWVVNIYLLALGAFVLIGGASGDWFGSRRVFVLGLLVFGAASLGCALVNSLPSLLLWRGLQGLGAAMLVPASLALISYHFDKQQRGRAFGIWAGASALTTAPGPMAGGWLVDNFGWPSVFLAVPVLAAATLGLALWRVPVAPDQSDLPLDYGGAALLATALALTAYGLINAQLSALTVCSLISAGLCAFLFVRHERSIDAPMLPFELFESSAFTGANSMTLGLYFALGGALFFVPFNLIQIQGYSALAAGAAFLPLTLLLGLGSAFGGDLIRRYLARQVLTSGAVIAGIGFAALSVPGVESRYLHHWLPGIVLIGLGMTLCVAPLTTVVMNSVDDAQAGVASDVNNTAARLAGVLAIAVLTGIAVQLFTSRLDQQLVAVRISSDIRVDLLAHVDRLAELHPPADLSVAIAEDVSRLIDESYVYAFRRLMFICAGAAWLSALVAWVTLRLPEAHSN